jgi:hypothetical protein
LKDSFKEKNQLDTGNKNYETKRKNETTKRQKKLIFENIGFPERSVFDPKIGFAHVRD